MIEEVIMRALGWCPGVEAAAEFNQRRGTEKVAGLLALLGVWLMGYWWMTSTALSLYGMEKMLFVNRTTLMLVLSGILIIGYTWKQFKPSDWEIPEFNYHTLSIDDLPDIPIDASYTWMSKGSNPSTGPGLRSSGDGFDVAGELRSTDIEWYRDKVEYYRNLRDERLRREGKPVPKRPSNKTPIIRIMLMLVLIIGSAFTYSYMVLRPQQMSVESYAFNRLSGYDIIVVHPYDDKNIKPMVDIDDFNEFVSLARQQNIDTIYYEVDREPSNYFVFNSPIYDEAYRIYLNVIDG